MLIKIFREFWKKISNSNQHTTSRPKKRELVYRRMDNILKNLELHVKMKQPIGDNMNKYKKNMDEE